MSPAVVGLPPLPPDAPSTAVSTYQLLSDFLAIRHIGDPPEEPFPFSTPFLARWAGAESGLDEKTIRENPKRAGPSPPGDP